MLVYGSGGGCGEVERDWDSGARFVWSVFLWLLGVGVANYDRV